MTQKDIEKMLEESGGLDTSHLNKDDILAKARQEMYFGASAEESKNTKRSSSPFRFKKRFIPLLAGAALACTICVGMIGIYNENFQTIYIDINPSVALKLNRFERVIGVEFLNEDAKALLSNTKLVGCDATSAVQTVITACDSAGYVKEDSEIYLSASAKQEKASEKLLNKLKGHTETMGKDQNEAYSVNTYNAKKGEKKEFEKESLSPAKYNIIKEIIEEDDDYKLEDLKGKSMSELNKIKHRHNDDRDDDDFDDDDFDDDDRFEDDDRDDDDRDENHNNGKPDKESEEKPNEKPNNSQNGKHEDDDDDRDNDNRYDNDNDDDDDDDDDKRENGKKTDKGSRDD